MSSVERQHFPFRHAMASGRKPFTFRHLLWANVKLRLNCSSLEDKASIIVHLPDTNKNGQISVQKFNPLSNHRH